MKIILCILCASVTAAYLWSNRDWICNQWPLSGGQVHRSIFPVPCHLNILLLLGLVLNLHLDFWFLVQAEIQRQVIGLVNRFHFDCHVVWQWGDVFRWGCVGGGGEVARWGDMSVGGYMSAP